MIHLNIDGNPTPWTPSRITRTHSYNPKHREKQNAIRQIESQYDRSPPLLTAIRLQFTFHMPIPISTSKVRRKAMLEGRIKHTKRPDTSNLVKFAEDCIKGVVIHDDSQVVELTARKVYGEMPHTSISVESLG